jgi:antitoxin (DNA-binding transcriptional repressor) of toxin-antitoxin stability system
MSTVTLEEVQAQLPELLERLPPGEAVLIMKNARPIAQLIPLAAAPSPVFGSCQGMLTLVSDDKDHLTDFAEYMP